MTFKMKSPDITDPKHKPHLFFMPRDTGEVDSEDQPIFAYDEENEDTTANYAEGKCFRRKSAKSFGDLHFYRDGIRFYDDEILVADTRLFAEVFHNGEWRTKQFEFDADTSIVKQDRRTLRAWEDQIVPALDNATARFGWQVKWTKDDAKQTFLIDVPGKLVRLRWMIRFFVDPTINENGERIWEGLKLSHADYDGNTSETFNEVTNTLSITFEPDGVMGRLLVDPYLIVDETSPTITVTTDEDVIVFTKATADAELIESNPARVVIRETYYQWTLYPTRMFRWRHDTGATTTGMAGNSYSAVQVSGELYWYPLTSAEDTDEATITTQLQDMVLGAFSTGSKVTDLNVPDIFGGDCFASDGAHHAEPDANRQIILPWDRDRIRPAVVVHDFGFLSGSDPTNHLKAFLKCNEFVNTDYILEEVGQVGNAFVVSGSPDFIPAVQGNGLHISDISQGVIQFLETGNYLDMDKGAFIFEYIPDNDSADFVNADARFFNFEGGPAFSAIYGGGSTRITFYYAGNSVLSSDVTFIAGQKYTLHFFWYNSAGGGEAPCFHGFAVNGEVKAVGWNVSDQTDLDVVMEIGNSGSGSNNEIEGIIDNIKILDDCLLPHGAPITLFNQVGDYSKAHESILLYWDCEAIGAGAALGGANLATPVDITVGSSGGDVSALAKLVGTNGYDNEVAATNYFASIAITDGDYFNPSKGKISFWFNLPAYAQYDALFTFRVGGEDYIHIYTLSDELSFNYRIQNRGEFVNSTGLALNVNTGVWFFVEAMWGDADNGAQIELKVNGVSMGTDIVANAWDETKTETLFLGANSAGSQNMNVWIDQVVIQDDPYAPQAWSFFGKERHRPLIEVS